MKDQINILLGVLTLIGITYRVFQVESAIHNSIKELKALLIERITLNEVSLRVHIAVYEERKGHVDYLLHGLDEKMDHKFNRLLKEIEEMKAKQKAEEKYKEN